jgi:hypothetical protein
MFRVIHASGALKAFLDARSRGRPEAELSALKVAAAAEGAYNPSRARRSSFGCNVVDRERLDRARRERAEARRAFAPTSGPAA